MNIEDIKIGETYNVRMHVSDYYDGIIFCSTVISDDDKDGLQCGEEYEICHDEVDAFSPINPYTPLNLPTMTEIPEAYPKYDPCRLFKAGDVVEYRPKNGRANPNMLVGRKYKVHVDEPCDSGIVQVEIDPIRHIDTFVSYDQLKLVTPVEELEPYTVGKAEINTTDGEYDTWAVYDEHGYIVAQFAEEAYKPGEAKARAEAERDSRNAEWRKEMEK